VVRGRFADWRCDLRCAIIKPLVLLETVMTTLEIKLSLPDSLAKEAQRAGLLSPEALEKLIAEALRRKAFDELLTVADRIEVAGIPPMSMEEINAEIEAYRAERRGAGR
jgi:hypothetical protein